MGAAVAAGLAPLALGSDGAGSIRIPASWCGLYGLKPQRGRVPIAAGEDPWNGLSVSGPLSRTVEDAALFLDVTYDGQAPRGGFLKAAAREPGRLRIAFSTKLPPTMIARLGRPQQRALDGMETLHATWATRCSGMTRTIRRGRCTATCCPGCGGACTRRFANCPTRSGWSRGRRRSPGLVR